MLTYAVLLLILGIVLAFMEVLLPSGGILAILSTGAIIGAIVMAFGESADTGVVFLAITAVLVPVTIVLGLKVFPRTPVGRRMILKPETETVSERGSAGVSDGDYSKLMGKTGKTVTPLRPSGIAEIEGERYSVVAEGDMIGPGVDIIVVNLEGNSIVVNEQEKT
jgi:membrane-bound serine protease (ClpP class)